MKTHLRVLLSAALLGSAALIVTYVVREPLQRSVSSFLSLTKPIKAEVLVVEGWLSDRMLKEAAAEFLRGGYSYCLVSGKIPKVRSPVRALVGFGIDSTAVKFTDAETRMGHNTYHIALAARQWIQVNDSSVSTINVFTAGPHGRKSWTIFRRVFGRHYTIGVLSSSIVPSDTALWWGSKQGRRNMVKYGVGYVYAWLWPFED